LPSGCHSRSSEHQCIATGWEFVLDVWVTSQLQANSSGIHHETAKSLGLSVCRRFKISLN